MLFRYISCWLLLIFAETVPLMKLMQVFYGLATAAEIGYYSYIYRYSFTCKYTCIYYFNNSCLFNFSVVDSEHYQKVTGYARASTQTGLFLGSLLSQLLISLAHSGYQLLNYISLADVTIAFFISWLLPLPKRSMFFFSKPNTQYTEQIQTTSFSTRDTEQLKLQVCLYYLLYIMFLFYISLSKDFVKEIDNDSESNNFLLTCTTFRSVLYQLWFDLKRCYATPVLLRWSIWWMFSTCGWILVVNYTQNLWETIRPSTDESNEIFNGAVESLATLLGK